MHTRKRPRIQVSPFLMTMEDDPMEQVELEDEGFSFEIYDNNSILVEEKVDEDTFLFNETITAVQCAC
jgi:hypothetical protein